MQDEQVGKETVMSEKDILARIRKRPYSLKEFDMTEAHCLAAVKANGLVLRLIRKSLQTTAICKAAVKQNGLALQHVSPKLLTLTMCVEAVKKDADAIRFVPESMRSVTKTILAVPSNGRRLGLVPAEKRTAALCAAAVANHPLALEFVPNRHKTEKLCAAAVVHNGQLQSGAILRMLMPSSCRGGADLHGPVDDGLCAHHRLGQLARSPCPPASPNISCLMISAFCGDAKKIKGVSWVIGVLAVAMLTPPHCFSGAIADRPIGLPAARPAAGSLLTLLDISAGTW